jgi:uncharacterized protein YjbI with pentapeptide repeats
MALLCAATLARGAINVWEMNSQGIKVQSAFACPDGASLMAGPNADLSNKDLTQGFFSAFDLKNTSFVGATLANASFDYSQLVGTASGTFDTLSGTVFNNADISGAFLNYATYHGFTQEQFQSTESYKQKMLYWTNPNTNSISGINLTGNNLTGWNFSGQNLTSASFNSSMLGSADLTGATLANATFRAASFDGAVFKDAIINGDANNLGADFSSTSLTQAQLQATKSYQDKNLYGIRLSKNNLNGWDFSGQSLQSAFFANSNLTGAVLKDATINGDSNNPGADFSRTTGLTQAQLQSTASYKSKNLEGIQLNGNNLSGWDFHGQDLANASFSSDTLMDSVHNNPNDPNYVTQILGFRNNLSRSNFMGSPFGSAALGGATFTDAVISNAKFNFTTSQGFSLAQLQSTKSYQDKDLSGIQFQGNDLSGWDFNGQNLANASFNFSTMSGTNFSQSNLANTSFTGSNLSGAVFTDATINGDANNSGADFSRAAGLTLFQLQSTASYKNKNLFGLKLKENDLSGWDFSGQNLSNANLSGANLSGANFTNADIRGTYDSSTGKYYSTILFFTPTLTEAQLESTSNYQQHDMSFIRFSANDLNGWDFQGQNLTASVFAGSSLTNTDFTNATIHYADFSSTALTLYQLQQTSSYKQKNLEGIGLAGNNLSHWDFSGQDLASANLYNANLTGTNLSGATIRGASLVLATSKGFSQKQLQSTASYQQKDLSGINFSANNFTGWDFHEQDLSNAVLNGVTLNGANFTSASLANAKLFSISNYNTNLKGTDFTLADMRGATGDYNALGSETLPEPYILKNTIQMQGGIHGFDLSDGSKLIVRNYTGDPSVSTSKPIPITVYNKMSMGTSGILQMVFDDQDWNSTISFSGISSVSLGGTLKLTIKDGVDVSKLVGDSFDLFDWTGVNRLGTTFNVDQSGYTWNLDNLYTDGTVTFEGQTTSNSLLAGDSSANGLAAGSGLTGMPSGGASALSIAPVPEPASLGLLIMGLLSLVAWKFRRGRRTASV